MRRLIAISEELALTRAGADREGKRTILGDVDPGFVLHRVGRRPVKPPVLPGLNGPGPRETLLP